MGNIENIKPYQFKPGQSGNPKGRPKGTGLTDRLRSLLDADNGKRANDFVKRAYEMAVEEGDFRFWNAIMERLEGKVADRVQHSGDGGGPVQVNFIRATDPRKKKGGDDAVEP